MGRRRRNKRLIQLHLCFTNFIHPFLHDDSLPTSSQSLHHRQINHSRPSPSIIKNFNSLYDNASTAHPHPQPDPDPADFATAFASQRFFFSSPGRSNSIVESTPPSSSSSSSSLTAAAPPREKKKAMALEGSVAVPTYSPDPYMDFRRSMQEMVEARPEVMEDVKSNWHVLHELLLCYLALNPKSTHRIILNAFSDLLVSLVSFSSSPDLDDVAAAAGC